MTTDGIDDVPPQTVVLIDYVSIWLPLPPVCRIHPRDDGRGMSPGPRIHPHTKARRIIGGYL